MKKEIEEKKILRKYMKTLKGYNGEVKELSSCWIIKRFLDKGKMEEKQV